MKKLFFTISLFCAIAANACQCPLPIPPFHYATCTMFNSSTAGMVDRAIVMGVITGYYEYGTYLKILEPIYDSVNNDTILVWGNTGFTCRTDLMAFEETDTLILVVRRVQNAHSELEHFTDYWIDACATNYLYYSNNTVYGYINEGVSSMPYTDFVQMLQECLPTVGIAPQEETAAEIAVTCNPNPAQGNMVTVQFTLPFAAEIQVSVYDVHGRQVLNPVQQQYYNKGVHNLPIQLQQLPAQGIYFCRISAGNATGICKIVLLR
ncbi:T9SS C-terminal target domain-containing protein [Sphingobacteriales bacterium UPWRP_1]|nr:hypothetical protein B6N25_15045 [Sphingobacteriales bacterium TSM_CSS]PSJ74659.1 T9SS C-terminal target domain-containing protein [Sphingobacteriales bacterium UPWRP_1]